MGKIKELSRLLSDQIAAGEVIERPASVVKELVENSIDAHASQIQIIIQAAGQELIRVIDNGDGIENTDIELAFKRHATSKITSRHDLFQINSLGFRGEALPSISSVADVLVQSKAKIENEGFQFHIRGGEILDKRSYMARQGTSISVRELFYNTPARLKYLKSRNTEIAKISDIVTRLALANPNIAFSLLSDGKTLLQTVGNNKLKQTIASIYSIDMVKNLIEVENEDDHFKMRGFISKPTYTRSSRDYLTILVNGRYVKDFGIFNAIIKGYGSKLMVGRFPVGVLEIELDPLWVDVNVHPQKAEIRIANANNLLEFITDTVRKNIFEEVIIPNGLETINNDVLEESLSTAETITVKEDEISDIVIEENVDSIAVEKTNLDLSLVDSFKSDLLKQNKEKLITNQELELDIKTDKETFPYLRYIGQYHGTFLLAEGSKGLYLLDQHAAQERINYEYYLKLLANPEFSYQQLLTPLLLQYTSQEYLLLLERKEELLQFGLAFEEFGNNSIVFNAYPTWIEQNQVEEVIKDIIDQLLLNKTLSLQDFREKSAAMIACKHAIKANQHLDKQQAESLIEKLAKTANPYNCPHGRPTLINLTDTDLEKMFKRIQDNHMRWEEYDSHPF